MELKLSKDHHKIDLRNLSLPKVKRFNARLGSVGLSIALLSGSGLGTKVVEASPIEETTSYTAMVDPSTYTIVEHDKSDVVSIPSNFYPTFDDTRQVQGGNYTYEDLEHVVSATVLIHDDMNYEFLNYMPNIRNLSITDQSNVPKLQNIDGSRFPTGITITISQLFGNSSFCEERYGFLKDISQIENLTVGSSSTAFRIHSSFLQSLKNVKNLKLALDATSNFKYQDFSYLSSLELIGKPYDIAMHFSNAELDELINRGIPVICQDIDKVKNINQQITEIIQTMNLSSNATDQEKLNAILEYVLQRCQYDENVFSISHSGQEVPEELKKVFYRDGEMTAAFEDSTQICGNYAALTATLCRELGLDVYFMDSSNHAWDAIKVGDYFYYVDPTWLDGSQVTLSKTTYQSEDGMTMSFEFVPMTAEEVLKSDDPSRIEKFPWYMEDPTNFNQYEDSMGSHQAEFIPIGLELVPVDSHQAELEDILSEQTETTQTAENSEKINEGIMVVEDDTSERESELSSGKFNVHINGKTIAIGSAAFAGIMAALGVGVLLHRQKKKRRERIRFQQQMDDDFGLPLSF